MGKATKVKFGRYIQMVHANKSRLKIWEKMERGRIQGLPQFFEYPLLSQERIKLRISNLAGYELQSWQVANPWTPQIFEVSPIISGMGNAMNVKFGRYSLFTGSIRRKAV